MHPHTVGFYDHESYLVSQVMSFIAPGLAAGAAGVVIAAPENRRELEQRLRPRSGREDPARQRLITLDARETMQRFMVGDWPDERRFQEVIGGVIRDAGERGNGEVRAFGEMVALLWEEGKREAAIRLERLWTDLASTHSFSLHCAYPRRLFTKPEDAEGFRHVCDEHTDVLPAETPDLQPQPELHRVIAELQQKTWALESEVAQRRFVEQALRRREAELSDFLENAAEGLHKVGPDGTILWANRAELELLGYAPHEYIGRNVAEFHVDRQRIGEILKTLSSGETLYDVPAQLRCRDGSIKHVRIHSNVLFEEGRFVHTRCFTRDVTEQVRLERELQEKIELLQASDRAKDDFIAILGHELRNPLAPIVTAMELMQDTKNTAVITHACQVLERQVGLLRRLVDDLLDVTRIRNGKLELKREPVDLAELAHEAVEMTSARIVDRGHRVEIDVAPGLRVHGDHGRLLQALGNLVSNAANYTPPGGRIRVSAQSRDGKAVVQIVDNGVGMSPELCRTAFDMFVQAADRDRSQVGGLGLGLNVVRRIVELHGGRVRASSDGPGRGSTFEIELPAST